MVASTECQLQSLLVGNQCLNFYMQGNWQGNGDPPRSIPGPGFTHKAYDDQGCSIGGVAYVVSDTLIKWIVVWSNKEDEINKVKTRIIGCDDSIPWEEMKAELKNPEDSYSKFGYNSTVQIEPDTRTPKLMATLSGPV